jgi:hypothetical protein
MLYTSTALVQTTCLLRVAGKKAFLWQRHACSSSTCWPDQGHACSSSTYWPDQKGRPCETREKRLAKTAAARAPFCNNNATVRYRHSFGVLVRPRACATEKGCVYTVLFRLFAIPVPLRTRGPGTPFRSYSHFSKQLSRMCGLLCNESFLTPSTMFCCWTYCFALHLQ